MHVELSISGYTYIFRLIIAGAADAVDVVEAAVIGAIILVTCYCSKLFFHVLWLQIFVWPQFSGAQGCSGIAVLLLHQNLHEKCEFFLPPSHLHEGDVIADLYLIWQLKGSSFIELHYCELKDLYSIISWLMMRNPY